MTEGSDKYYENYPCSTIIISNLVSLCIYLAGIFIVYQFGLLWASFYAAYIVFLEFRLMSKSCVNCYYYGKCCAFGKGKISALFFGKGDHKKFGKREMSWKDILPDFMVSILPIIAGAYLLVIDFSWTITILIILILLLTTAGNGFVRGNLACKYCIQRKSGCPAEKLFDKKKK